jgi:hypothetical protein
MRKGARQWRWLVAMVSLASTVLLWWTIPRDRLLLEHATKIASTKGWYRQTPRNRVNETGTRSYAEAYWLSDHTLLYQQSAKGHQPDGGDYCLWDLKTGTEKPLPMLTRCIIRSRGPNWPLQVSPDGQWICLSGAGMMVCRLDGTQVRTSVNTGDAVWLPDSRHLLVNIWSGHRTFCVRRSVIRSETDVEVPLPEGQDLGQVLPDGRMILLWVPNTGPDTARLVVACCELHTAFRKIWSRTLTWPAHSQLEDYALSPQGDRIASLVAVESNSALLQVMHRLLPQIRVRPAYQFELWVSRIDGTERHKVGVVPFDAAAYQQLNSLYQGELDQIRWLPGGEQLSFVYKEDLYTVSSY